MFVCVFLSPVWLLTLMWRLFWLLLWLLLSLLSLLLRWWWCLRFVCVTETLFSSSHTHTPLAVSSLTMSAVNSFQAFFLEIVVVVIVEIVGADLVRGKQTETRFVRLNVAQREKNQAEK